MQPVVFLARRRLGTEVNVVGPVGVHLHAVSVAFGQANGIDIEWFNKRFKVDFYQMFGQELERLEDKGLVRIKSGRCFLSGKGMLFLDSVVDLLVGGELTMA